ncbi:MAG: manganese efflux pump MntP family protein [Breznakibacter sp.]
MDFISQLLLALSLTADTFAVAISVGLMVSSIRFGQATKIGVIMALGQASLPLFGWLIGTNIKDLVADYDHWIALGLLSLIGIHMIIEGAKDKDDRKTFNPFKLTVLFTIAIATSIDAFVVGITLGFTDSNIFFQIGLIAIATYLVAMVGMLFGKTAGKHLSHRMGIFGGIILVGLGIKIFLEHWMA